ncbi:MAG: hypothetical protein J5746_14275, partial [Victivallales bacterium]|nr:hypothetical protein [Victivallales bacterium]
MENFNLSVPLIEKKFFEMVNTGNFNRNACPPFEDRASWEKLLQVPHYRQVAEAVIQDAEKLLDKPIPTLLASERRRYVLDGNRMDFENQYFARRSNLGLLVSALCLTGDTDRFLPLTLDYINAILEEWTWVVPAHLQWENGYPSAVQGADLFACDTAATLGQVLMLLEGLLQKSWASLAERIRKEVLQRVVYATLNPDTLRLCWWYFSEFPNNWTPWCVYNSLQAAVACERDSKKLDSLFQHYVPALTRFVNYAFDDGYCHEGPMYSLLGAGMLFKCLAMMERMVPGCTEDILSLEKLRRMFNFPGELLMGKKYFLSYGDCQPCPRPMLSVAGQVAAKYGAPGMIELTRMLGPYFWRITNHYGDLEDI